MQSTNYDPANQTDFNVPHAVHVLVASGVLDSMPLMVVMARRHFSYSMRSRTGAVGNLRLCTRLTDERISGLGDTSSEHYVANMDVALLDEKLQVWEFSLPSGMGSVWQFAYRIVADGETAQIMQIDVG